MFKRRPSMPLYIRFQRVTPARFPKLITLLLSLCCMCCGSTTQSPSGADIVEHTVQSGEFIAGIQEVGRIEAKHSKSVNSTLRSKIVKMLPEGTEVLKSDTVVWLDPEDIQKSLDNERIQVKRFKTDRNRQLERLKETLFNLKQTMEETMASLEYNRLQVQLKQKDLELMQSKFERKLVAEKDVLQAEAELLNREMQLNTSELAHQRAIENYNTRKKTLKSDVEIANLEFENSQFHLRNLENQLERTELKAPGSGIVIHAQKWNKEKYKVGDRVHWGTRICEIPDLSEMKVLSQITEAHFAAIHVGQQVVVQVNALNDSEIKGTVSSISELAVQRKESAGSGFVSNDKGVQNMVFEIEVALEKTDLKLRPGMGVSLVIVSHHITDAKTVPIDAVLEENGTYYVYIKGINAYEKQLVVPGPASRTSIVINRGLDVGDVVAVVNHTDKQSPGRGQQKFFNNKGSR